MNQLDKPRKEGILTEEEFENKKKSLLLSESYKRLGLEKKSFRVSECGTFLEFKKFVDGSLKLNGANFCKVRLCPMCSWRRSLKIFSQVSEIMNYFGSVLFYARV